MNISGRRRIMIFVALMSFHFIFSGAMYLTATSEYLADYHNGKGLWNFGLDSFDYHLIAQADAAKIGEGNHFGNEYVSGWLNSNNPWHTRWISLSYYLFGPCPFSFEPVNGLLWSLSVCLVFLIARTITGGDSILSAASGLMYGLFPSNLALSTQLLKDPFYNFGALMIIFGWVSLLAGRGGWKTTALLLAGVALVRVVRPEYLPLIMFLFFAGSALVYIWARRSTVYALMALVLSSIFMALLTQNAVRAEKAPPPSDVKRYFDWKVEKLKQGELIIERAKKRIKTELGKDYNAELDRQIEQWFKVKYVSPRALHEDFEEKERSLMILTRAHGAGLSRFLSRWIPRWKKTGWAPDWLEDRLIKANSYRDNFLSYYAQKGSSSVDSDTVFRSMSDMVSYLPRAVQIGFLAPFPNMWFSVGHMGGKAVRYVSGFEMLIWYFLIAGFARFLVAADTPIQIKIWVTIFLVVTITPLGLLVPNLGTLHRMRHVYMTPVLVCGLIGLKTLLGRRVAKAKLELFG